MVAVGDLMKVTRDDIQDFPGDTINLIIEMQKAGWRAQRSNRNHVMLFAPDGETRLSASRNPDSAKYLGEDLRKYNKANGKETVEPVKVRTVAQKWPCPRTNCPKIFASEAKLNAHIGVDHEKQLKCPDCDETFSSPKVLGAHRSRAHGYVSPRYAARKKLEADRKKLVEEVTYRLDAEKGIVKQGQILKDDEVFENKLEKADRIANDILGEVDEVKLTSEGIYATGKLNAGVLDSGISLVRSGSDIVGASLYTTPEQEDVGHIEFLDDRDSWTMKLDALTNQGIHDLRRTLEAAGLQMEIRVWREG